MATKLAIAINLDQLEPLMDAYLAKRGDGDGNLLLRQLALGDFLYWLQQQRMETTNGPKRIESERGD